MKPEDYGDSDQRQCEDPGSGGKVMFGPRQSRQVNHERRVQLLRHAERIAADVLEHTKPHERCLLRRMVENLLPGEE